MGMVAGTLQRYFALRFAITVLAVFAGLFVLVAMVDFIEMMRRTMGVATASIFTIAQASLFRVPQVTERVMPFAALVGAMLCYLTLSRRHELVIARSAGMSAWQFIAPALAVALLVGVAATTVYNPLAAALQDRSDALEAELFGTARARLLQRGSAYWLRQRSEEGQAVINASSSRDQGVELSGVTVFRFDQAGRFVDRIEARSATLETSRWRLDDVTIHASGTPAVTRPVYLLPTALSAEQVRESFATPETISFWSLPLYISIAEQSGLGAAGYRLQYHKLLAKPFFLAAMVLLAAAVSLRIFRFGGVQRMVLGGIIAGFLLYVVSKIADDLTIAQLLHPVAAAWLPVVLGGLTGLLALLYQEDG
jgi:lipopolysaccharide export system permease protein